MMLMIFWQRLRDTSSPLSSFTLSGAGYAPFPLDAIDCKEAKDGKVGLPNDRIFLSLLKTLHKEDKDDADGLLAALSDHAEVVDLKKLDETIKQSLLDRGNPVEMCKIDGFASESCLCNSSACWIAMQLPLCQVWNAPYTSHSGSSDSNRG
jgi:hypothetical protein